MNRQVREEGLEWGWRTELGSWFQRKRKVLRREWKRDREWELCMVRVLSWQNEKMLYLAVKRFALCYRTVVLSVCNVGLLCTNGWMDENETWHSHGGRPRPRPHCVRWGPSFPPKKAQQPPTFWPMYCGEAAGSRCHLVWRYASAQATLCCMVTQLPLKGLQQSAHVYCGQTVAHPS